MKKINTNLFSCEQSFLFQCDDCFKILVLFLEKEEDIKEYHNDNIIFECSCSGTCVPIRN